MIIRIDDLEISPTIMAQVEKFNADSANRSSGGRLIIKLSPYEKWRITLSYGENTILNDFMFQLYAKCQEMRKTAKNVTFISNYDGSEITAIMMCTRAMPPRAISISNKMPQFYNNAGAVFEEV